MKVKGWDEEGEKRSSRVESVLFSFPAPRSRSSSEPSPIDRWRKAIIPGANLQNVVKLLLGDVEDGRMALRRVPVNINALELPETKQSVALN